MLKTTKRKSILKARVSTVMINIKHKTQEIAISQNKRKVQVLLHQEARAATPITNHPGVVQSPGTSHTKVARRVDGGC